LADIGGEEELPPEIVMDFYPWSYPKRSISMKNLPIKYEYT